MAAILQRSAGADMLQSASALQAIDVGLRQLPICNMNKVLMHEPPQIPTPQRFCPLRLYNPTSALFHGKFLFAPRIVLLVLRDGAKIYLSRPAKAHVKPPVAQACWMADNHTWLKE